MVTKLTAVPNGILGLNISGEMGKNDFNLIDKEIGEYSSRTSELCVLLELESFPWLSINDFWNCMRQEVNFPKSTKKIAIKTSSEWLDKTSGLLDIITPFKIQTFHLDAHELATDWLGQSLPAK